MTSDRLEQLRGKLANLRANPENYTLGLFAEDAILRCDDVTALLQVSAEGGFSCNRNELIRVLDVLRRCATSLAQLDRLADALGIAPDAKEELE